jgi:hypothetical protein
MTYKITNKYDAYLNGEVSAESVRVIKEKSID